MPSLSKRLAFIAAVAVAAQVCSAEEQPKQPEQHQEHQEQQEQPLAVEAPAEVSASVLPEKNDPFDVDFDALTSFIGTDPFATSVLSLLSPLRAALGREMKPQLALKMAEDENV